MRLAPKKRPSLSAYQERPKPTHSATPTMASTFARKRKGLEALVGRGGYCCGKLRLVRHRTGRAQRRPKPVGAFEELLGSLWLQRGRTLDLCGRGGIFLGRGNDERRRLEIDAEHRLDLDIGVRIGHELLPGHSR